jgi:hypothetical protein
MSAKCQEQNVRLFGSAIPGCWAPPSDLILVPGLEPEPSPVAGACSVELVSAATQMAEWFSPE